MKDIDYSSWADYIIDLIDLYQIENPKVLEVGAGLGQISSFLKEKIPSYIVSDVSVEMMKYCPDKISRVTCDMTSLPFKKEFDIIFSIFDSVNYLTTPDLFVDFLSECKRILVEDGIVTFDVSLEKNSVKNIKRLNRKGEYGGVNYNQKSIYDRKSRLHKNILELEIEEVKYIETHEQMIYEFEEYFIFVEDAGLRVIDCFDCFTFDDASRKSERVQFVLGKL